MWRKQFFVSLQAKLLKMRRLFLCATLLLMCQLLMAGSISRTEARQRAAALLGTSAEPELVLAAAGEQPAYYIYNNKVGQGFVIVAGDDAVDGVLGWSSEGCFDPGDMPPALRQWLAMMEEQSALVRQGRAAAYRSAALGPRVEPLLATQWDQGTPYNLLAPEYQPGTRAATGCMATAMAQVLRYHAYGQPTTAIPAYTTATHSLHMGALPATTFDYALMSDSYRSGYTPQAADEVARLMRYCGQAVNMDYGESSGASPMLSAFASYFGYNPYAYYAERYQYPAYAWESLIYQQVSAGRPVLMAGYTFSSVGYEGHAYVCDGYDGNGLFHFNWGWSGSYDGWYKLSECNPFGSGTGGSHGWDGFSIEPGAMINLIPQQLETEFKIRMTVADLSTTQTRAMRDDVSEDFVLLVTATAYNMTAASHTFDVGLALYTEDNELDTSWTVDRDVEMSPYVGVQFPKLLAIGEGVSSGRYYLRFVCRKSGDSQWQWGYNGDIYLILTIDGNTMTIERPKTDLVVNSITFEGSLQPHTLATMRLNITNRGERLYDNLFLFVDNQQTTGVGLYVDPGTTQDVVMHFAVPDGAPELKLYTDIAEESDNSYQPVGRVLWAGPMADYRRDEQGERARQLAETRLGAGVVLAAQGQGEQPAYFVYNALPTGTGFAIVAPEDEGDGILGYSDMGSFDPDDVPPGMADWLECWEGQLAASRATGTAAPQHRASRRAAAIAPLLSTKWGQRSPYNNMAPEYAPGSHCAAGCLAVAMAQVLKYWASPATTTEIPAYKTEELGLQLEALPPRSFDYSIMRDEYGMFDKDAGAQEVAALMRYCGQAAEMDYDINSGANTSGEYLSRFFGFDSGYTDKDYLTHMSGWDDLIYDELAAGRPVMYSGKKMSGFLKFSGHVFVVDGYDGDGLFHFNWGWNGNDDGYFKLTSADGYNLLQMAVIGLQPAAASSVTAPPASLQRPSPYVFDLNGRRILEPASRGVHILNGKKVLNTKR